MRLRFKDFMRERIELSECGDETLLSVSEYYGVRARQEVIEPDEYLSRSASLEGYRKVHAGDLVMNYMLAWKGAHGISPVDGIVSPAYAVFSVDGTIADGRYIHHRLRSEQSNADFRSRSKGIIDSRLRLYPDAFLAMPIELPKKHEQSKVADFLDREIGRIDQLIKGKEELKLKLEERFQALVTVTVTGQSADHTGSVRPTGHTWNPNIPKHWATTRLKDLCSRVVDCLHETPSYSDSGEIPAIRTADIARGKVMLGRAKRVSVEEYLWRIQRLEPEVDDILYTREGERFGLAALVPPSTRLCLGQRMMMFRVRKQISSEYVMWSLNGNFAYHFLKQSTAGATSPHLNIADIRNVPIFLPPEKEQRELGSRLTQKRRELDAALAPLERSVDILQELRSALITAAVTGQIDIATWGKRGRTEVQRIEAEASA